MSAGNATATVNTAAPPLGQASQELLDHARRYADEKARAQIEKETAGQDARYAELEKMVEELQEQVKSLSNSKGSSRKASTRSGSTTSLKSPSKRLFQSSTSLTSQIPPQPVFSASTSALRKASEVPRSATQTTSTSIDPVRLAEDYTRLQNDHARLKKKYAALAAVHEENSTKYSRERKIWRDFKRLIKTVMDTTPGFKQACAQIQKEMEREDDRVLDAALSKTAKKGSTSRRSDEGGSPVARVSFDSGRMLPTQATSVAAVGSAIATAKVTGKRKRGQEEQTASATKSGRKAGSSYANATSTKNRSSQLSYRNSPAGPAQKPLRTPTKRYAPPAPISDHNENDLPASARSSRSRVPSHREAGHANQPTQPLRSETQPLQPRTAYSVTAAAAVATPPRQQENEAGPRSFSDCSDIYLAAVNEAENAYMTSDPPEPPSGQDESAAEAYARDEAEARRVAYEAYQDIEMNEDSDGYEEWYRPPLIDKHSLDDSQGASQEQDRLVEELEVAESLIRRREQDYELLMALDFELDEALQGPTSSQFHYLEAAARPLSQRADEAAIEPSLCRLPEQAKDSEKPPSNKTSGLACIFPLPENAYKQVSPSKSVMDESVPVHALRKRVRAHHPTSSGPNVKPNKEQEEILHGLLFEEAARMHSPSRQAHYGRGARSEHAPSDVSHDCERLGCCDAQQAADTANEAFKRSSEASQRDQTKRDMEMEDDEETETSSRPSSPARPPLTATVSAKGERTTSSGSHNEPNLRSSRTLMPDLPSTAEKRGEAVSSSPKLPIVTEDDLADQTEAKEESSGPAYRSSQRLHAYGKSAAFDESKDVVMRTLNKEKLPPRKAKQAENTPLQASTKEIVPPRPIEESNIGSFITDLRSESVSRPIEGTPQALSRAVASQSARAGSVEPPPGSAMWRHPAKKKQKEKRRASAIVAVASASILPSSSSTSSAGKQVHKRDASVMSRGKMGSAQVVGPAKDDPDAECEEQSSTSKPASRLQDLLDPNAAQPAGEDSASTSRATKATKSGTALASVLERTSAGVSAGLGSSSSKARKSLLAPIEIATPGDAAKRAAQKKKKGRGGVALPDDVEDDLTAVGRAILQAKGTPGGDGSADTPVTAKRLNVDQLLQQAEKKRQRESAGHSSLNRQKRKPESSGVIGNAETPTAESSSKRSKAEPGSAKEADKPSQPQRERDYSEPYEGQDFMRKIHRQRKAEMEGDPFKHKGKGAYAEQMAGALAAKNLARIEVNPDQNNGVPFVYKETVRGKEARKQLHGVDCDCCHGYFENAVRHLPVEQRADAIQKMINDTSRHRQQFEPAKTPPEYWQMGFPDSQGVEKIREEAEKINEDKKKKQEAEANKCDGRFRYR